MCLVRLLKLTSLQHAVNANGVLSKIKFLHSEANLVLKVRRNVCKTFYRVYRKNFKT